MQAFHLFGSSGSPELVYTENVSRHGVRVLTRRMWKPKDHVRLVALSGRLTCHAEVRYLDARPDRSCFAIGLRLINATIDLADLGPGGAAKSADSVRR